MTKQKITCVYKLYINFAWPIKSYNHACILNRSKCVNFCIFLIKENKITKNEQKNINETKYAYAICEPHSSSPFLASGSHGLPFKQANIMSGHASPVAHLNPKEIKDRLIFVIIAVQNLNMSNWKWKWNI